jgi:hypothetical protein
MGQDTFNAERARRPSAQWQATCLFLNKCRGCMTFRQGRLGSLCHGPQAAGLCLSGKRRRGPHTCQRWTPAHTPGSFSLQDPAGVRTYPKAPDSCIGVWCPFRGVRPYWGVVSFPATWHPLAYPSGGVRRGPSRGQGTSHGCDAFML